MTDMPAVSVVIATRNRAAILGRLLRAVKEQDLTAIECIVVDDGSSDETIEAYKVLWQELDDRFQLLLQAPEERMATGPSATRNRGITAARGKFIAFCDDDDTWVRTDHLSSAVNSMQQHGADLFFANMQTSQNGKILGPDFYGTVRRYLTRHTVGPDLYEVSRRNCATAMKHMFLHCDTIVASKQLLIDAGLFWEKLSMAEDRDLALRLLDQASKVIYRDVVTADYDRTAQVGICKTYTDEEIRQFVVMAMLHAETVMHNTTLRRVARGYRAWMLLELAQAAAETGRNDQTRELALQSLFLHPTASAIRQLIGGTHKPAAPVLRRAETR